MTVQDTLLEKEEQQSTDEKDTHEVGTFVSIAVRSMNEEDVIRTSISERQASDQDQVVPWPSRGNDPVNEFTTEGYMSCAFPTLFPTGSADFVAPRERKVTVGNYFNHLMRCGGGRFARHPRFRYFALNTEMRWRALQAGRIFIKRHPRDSRLS